MSNLLATAGVALVRGDRVLAAAGLAAVSLGGEDLTLGGGAASPVGVLVAGLAAFEVLLAASTTSTHQHLLLQCHQPPILQFKHPTIMFPITK